MKSDKTISDAFSVSIFDLSIGDNKILRNTLDYPFSITIDKLLLKNFENSKKILNLLEILFEKYRVLLKISSQNFISYTVSTKIWHFFEQDTTLFCS